MIKPHRAWPMNSPWDLILAVQIEFPISDFPNLNNGRSCPVIWMRRFVTAGSTGEDTTRLVMRSKGRGDSQLWTFGPQQANSNGIRLISNDPHAPDTIVHRCWAIGIIEGTWGWLGQKHTERSHRIEVHVIDKYKATPWLSEWIGSVSSAVDKGLLSSVSSRIVQWPFVVETFRKEVYKITPSSQITAIPETCTHSTSRSWEKEDAALDV